MAGRQTYSYYYFTLDSPETTNKFRTRSDGMFIDGRDRADDHVANFGEILEIEELV